MKIMIMVMRFGIANDKLFVTNFFMVRPRTILKLVSELVGWLVGKSQHKFSNKQIVVLKHMGMD